MRHALERTSPKGDLFVGRCLFCGEDGLPATAARDVECPERPGRDDQGTGLRTVLKSIDDRCQHGRLWIDWCIFCEKAEAQA